MLPPPHITRNSLIAKTLAFFCFLGGWAGLTSQAAVSAGGVAILGYTDTNLVDPLSDTFSIAALEEIVAGTTLYFTNNGWNSFDSAFMGATNGPGGGAGGEDLLKLTFTSNVAAGTLMQAGVDDAFSRYAWDTSGTILNTSSVGIGTFGLLNLPNNGDGDQIYIFEATPLSPLLNATNHIFMLDTGDNTDSDFEDAFSTQTGNYTPGLHPDDNTAFILPDPVFGDDAGDFHNGSFALDMTKPEVVALQLSGGTMAQWLALIVNDENWLKVNFNGVDDPDAESQLTSLNVIGVPEPSRTLLLGLGVAIIGLRRRRPTMATFEHRDAYRLE